jgi:hypothetical protein
VRHLRLRGNRIDELDALQGITGVASQKLQKVEVEDLEAALSRVVSTSLDAPY